LFRLFPPQEEKERIGLPMSTIEINPACQWRTFLRPFTPSHERSTARESENTRRNSLWIFRSIARPRQCRERPGVRLRKAAILLAVGWIASATALGQGNDRLVGVWD